MKALIVATVADFITAFEMNDIFILQSLGYEIHCATNFNAATQEKKMDEKKVKKHQIDFSRSPFSKENVTAYRQMKDLLEKEKFDVVHCHTPMGGVLARIATRKYGKKSVKVIYTAHGFHFFKGAPLKNWLVYYPVEKICSYLTDVLITINKEDYALAQRKMHAKSVVYIPGVGVDLNKFSVGISGRAKKRKELGIPEDAFLLLSVGELSPRKNHQIVIKALAELKKEDIYYCIAGQGAEEEHLKELIVKNNLQKNVKLLGFRSDISELLKAADFFILPSLQEGLSVALMEAMASGLPVVCSQIRGNVDLIDERDGRCFDPYSIEDCREAIESLLEKDLKEIGNYNAERVKEFGIDNVSQKMRKIYEMVSEK